MNKEGTRKGCKTIPRIRKSVEDIFAGLGPVYSRKSYRMRTDSFYKLHDMLFAHNPYPNKRKNGVTTNGPITSKSVLSQALRFLPVEQRMTLEVTMGFIRIKCTMLFRIL